MLFKNLYLTFVFILLIPINYANAVDCNDKSPNFIKQGDNYYNMQSPTKLSRKQKSEIKEILSSVKSRLTGTGVITECKGLNEDIHKVIVKEKITSEYRLQSDGRIMIDLDIFNLKKKAKYDETLYLFGASNDTYVLQDINNNSITAVYKWRKTRNKVGMPLNEKIVKLTVNEGVLNIDIINYINGYFASSYTRKLH